MSNKIKGIAAFAVGAALMSSAAYAECGDLSIAEMNWASAEFMANVDALILEKGYGCNIELVPGATTTTFAAMNEKSQPDVAPELWTNAVAEPLAVAMDEGRMFKARVDPIEGTGESWFVTPKFAADNPEIDTIVKLLERPDLFPDAEDPSKGALVGCPSGWGCQLATANLFRAFDMEAKGWKLVDPGSAAGLDGSVSKAAERDQNWVGYYWSPTALAGRLGLVALDWGVDFAGSENWDGCIVKPEQDCVDPKPSAWTKSEVSTVVTKEAKEKGGVALEYFANRVFPADVMGSMLVYMADEQAAGEDAAIEFMGKHKDLWKSWVSEEAAAKIEAAL